MAHKDRLAVEVVENLPGGCHIALEGHGRVLDDGYPVALGAKAVVDAAPSRSVDESAVDEDHGGSVVCIHRFLLGWVGMFCDVTNGPTPKASGITLDHDLDSRFPPENWRMMRGWRKELLPRSGCSVVRSSYAS
jgi:hypothetical protein